MADIETMTKRYFKLILGLFLFAVGTVITINANLGYSPWDVFHQGLGNIFGIKIGTANVIVGVSIVLIEMLRGIKPGIGTILNMLLIGLFMNIIMSINIIPTFSNMYIRILTIPVGMLIIGLGSYFYIGAGFGAGPRDGLMIFLIQKTNKSIRFIRNSIEITVLIIGYILRGPVGVGTVIISLGLGYAVQFVFSIFNFDPNEVQHRGWDDEVTSIKKLVRNI